jgi:hypothetical protein
MVVVVRYGIAFREVRVRDVVELGWALGGDVVVGAVAWRGAMTGVVDVGSEMNMRVSEWPSPLKCCVRTTAYFFISLAALFIASLWILIVVMATNY